MTDITDEQLAEWWDRASRLAAKDGGGVAWFESKLRRFAELARQEELEHMYRLIADDAWAISLQTFGQYRTALLKAILSRTTRSA